MRALQEERRDLKCVFSALLTEPGASVAIWSEMVRRLRRDHRFDRFSIDRVERSLQGMTKGP
jgi:hypothetical protein